MFVINPAGDLIYQGAIDSIPSADQADIPAATNYVQAALDESMAGKTRDHREQQAVWLRRRNTK